MRNLPLYGPTLLKISSDENLTLDIKQNAAIQLKNFVHSFWKFGENSEINKSLRFDDDEPMIVGDNRRVMVDNNDPKIIRSKNIVLIPVNNEPVLVGNTS